MPPEQILTCTYTVAATAELRTRFAARFGPELAARTGVRTINGVCASIISLYERSGHQAFRLITDESILRGLLRDIWLGAGYAFPTEGDLIAVIGKGHEAYRDREGVKTPFLERELIEEYARDIGLE